LARLPLFLCHPIVPDGQVTGLIPVRLGGVTKVTLFLKLMFLLFSENPSINLSLIKNDDDDDDDNPGARAGS